MEAAFEDQAGKDARKMKKRLFQEIPRLEDDRLLLRQITAADAQDLSCFAHSPAIYRLLPTFLYEQKYPDIHRVIDGLYADCLRKSLILGVFLRQGGDFCGLAEWYGFRDEIHKVSIGYRFLEACWGKGIASETVGLMIDWLLNETDIRIVTASTMLENKASGRVLAKNGFSLVQTGIDEDWGYGKPTPTDKWFLLLNNRAGRQVGDAGKIRKNVTFHLCSL